MCDPISLSLIGLATSTVGGIAQANTQSNYVDRVNAENKKAYEMSQRAREAERVRQKSMEGEMLQAYDETAADLTREKFDESKDVSAQTFLDKLASSAPTLTDTTRLPGQEGASVEVQNSINSRINKGAGEARDRVKALAALSSYGRAGEGRAQSVTNTGNTLSTLGGLRRGSLGVAQQEQNIQAADVTPGSSVFADILSGVGGAMAGMGGSGKSLFGGTGAGKAVIRPVRNPIYG